MNEEERSAGGRRAPLIQVRAVAAPELVRRRDEAAAIFGAALGLSALDPRVLAFPATVRRHAAEAGFRAVGAFAGERLVGFAEGYPVRPGQWWHDLVRERLAAPQRERWLAGAFELVELHLDPAHHGRGIGGRLHDLVLAGVGQRTAVLSTRRGATPASALYRRRGWVVLVDDMRFPGNSTAFSILGRDL